MGRRGDLFSSPPRTSRRIYNLRRRRGVVVGRLWGGYGYKYKTKSIKKPLSFHTAFRRASCAAAAVFLRRRCYGYKYYLPVFECNTDDTWNGTNPFSGGGCPTGSYCQVLSEGTSPHGYCCIKGSDSTTQDNYKPGMPLCSFIETPDLPGYCCSSEPTDQNGNVTGYGCSYVPCSSV